MDRPDARLSLIDRIYPLWQWLIYIPAVVLVTLLAALLVVPMALLASPRLANLQVGARWGRVLTRLVPVKVTIEGMDQIDKSQSYVVVANHQSQFDIPVVYGFSGLDLRWVAKAEVGRIPFVAAGCRAIGHIFINRSDPEQSRTAINRAVARLKPGTGLIFFAEGTRSRSGELMPFKKGAFRVALDQQLPVLPLTILGTRDVLPADTLRLRPGHVRIIVHPPIVTRGMGTGELGELRRRTRAVVASGMDQKAVS